MGKSYIQNKPVAFPLFLDVEKTAPIDARLVVDTVDDLTNGTLNWPYVGMVVNVMGTASLYVLTALPVTEKSNWKEIKDADKIKGDTDKLYADITSLETKHDKDKADLEALIEKTKNDILGGEGLRDTFDTLKEIQDWTDEHGTDYQALVDTVSKLETKHDEDKAELDKSISDLETKHDEDKAELDKSISDLETKHDKDLKDITTKHNTDKVALEQAIEDSELYDSDGAKEENKNIWETVLVGGVAKGTKPTAFEGKTVSEVLDMILYPTLQPTVTQPSVTLTYAGNSTSGATTVITVGDNLPLETAFTKTPNRGAVTYTNADGNKYYAGEPTTQTLVSNNSGVLGGPTTEGTYTITYSCTFAAGPKLLNNKGGNSTVAAYAGGTKTATKVFKSVYPIYINSGSITSMTPYTNKDYITGVELSDIVIPEETDDNKFEIHIPVGVKITELKQFNTAADAYNVDIDMVSDGTTTHNSVTYNKYVRTKISTDSQGVSKYNITLKKQ